MNDKKQKPLSERIAKAFGGENGSAAIDNDTIRDLAKLLEETGLSEIEI